MRRVAIIGAGIAGLQLGRRLQAQGLAVELFDKARGPAGRIATRRIDAGRFDHGAQYFTARAPGFVQQVEDWVARGVVAPWLGRIAVLEQGAAVAEATAQTRYVGVPSMSAIARDLAAGLEVRTGQRIVSVRRDDAKWTIASDAGFESGGFDWLVSAVPAPQAPPFLTASTQLTLQATCVRFLACHAAMVRFASPLDVEFDAAFVRGSALGWIAREASKPGRDPSNGWVLHSTPSWSEANVERPAEQVLVALCDALETTVGRALPALESGTVHRWLYARAEKPLAGAVLWDPELGLGLCGDWVLGDRVEDAYSSAERLAESMLASLERNELA